MGILPALVQGPSMRMREALLKNCKKRIPRQNRAPRGETLIRSERFWMPYHTFLYKSGFFTCTVQSSGDPILDWPNSSVDSWETIGTADAPRCDSELNIASWPNPFVKERTTAVPLASVCVFKTTSTDHSSGDGVSELAEDVPALALPHRIDLCFQQGVGDGSS
mmetsp:Transcript_4384/g.27930  ORF Transcript_4384/g.27930 Transcript_4384/m.27930 type:complete len:164 (-) Transcript_4384:560-1051(-)